MSKRIDFWDLLNIVQEHITEQYAAVLTDKENLSQLKSYIQKFLRDSDYEVDNLSFYELTEKLYQEMAEYSILTSYLGSPELEEINVNGWNDIALTYLDGSIVKLDEHFQTPGHAVDIVKRLLHNSGMIIDNATPISQGHLPNNSRITAIKEPVVDEDRGIAVSIRLLHPQSITMQTLLESNFATEEMLDFLCMCIRYGASVVIAGATSSGKTTLLNCLLSTIPDNKRIFTIESGSRELSLVKEQNGKIINNVVHTLSRPSDNIGTSQGSLHTDISQEKLVVGSLRFNPDVVVIGEMRDLECYSAVEASLTGHTVVSTVHAGGCAGTHMRIALLCQKKFPIDFNTSLIQAAQSFPVVVFTHKLENNQRKIMEIAEAEITPNGERRYRTLYNYQITKNTINKNSFEIEGCFNKLENMSDGLKQKLMQYGVPQDTLLRFLKDGGQKQCFTE
jgi:pilus assembly protein CpaF